MTIRKGLFCLLSLLFIVVCAVGCKTTVPSLGYIMPSDDVMEAYIGNKNTSAKNGIAHDGIYLDFGKDGGHTTKRVVWIQDLYGKNIYRGENSGVDLTGRLFSNSGAFIGAGTLAASPLWGYLGQKARRPDRTFVSSGGASASSDADAAGGAGGAGTGTATINPP